MAGKEQLKKAVKNPGGAPSQVIIQNIEVRGVTRQEQDVPKWRSAIKSFDSIMNRRQQLFTLYHDVVLDGHVQAVWSKRQDAVCDANWKFINDDDEEVDEINDLIDSVGFDNMLKHIIDTRAWGYTMMEPVFWKDDQDGWEMDAGLLPRMHYRPKEGVVTYQPYGDDGINVREGVYAKTVMEVGETDDMGLLIKAALYQVLKRGGLGDWAAFIQTFGNPIVDAVWDGFNQDQRLALDDALNKMGPGGKLIRPSGTEVNILENKAKDTGDAHGAFMAFLNTEISKALIGTTETTESSQSSGYAQSKTHETEDERKHDNDITFVRKVLNSRFKRILRAHGFNTDGGRFVIHGEETELTKKEMAEVYTQLAEKTGLPIDHDFLYETFGIGKPENYDELMAEKKAEKPEPEEPKNPPSPGGGAGGGGTEKKEPVELADKAWYLKLFERFFVKAPTSESVGACSHHTIELADDEGFDSERLIRRTWASNGKVTFDHGLYSYTADTLLRGLKKGWDTPEHINLVDAPGFEYGALDPAMLTAFEQNLFQFAGAKTLAEVQALNQAFRESESFEQFYQKAKDITEVYQGAWLETEYTTAVLTGESASTYYRLVKQANIFPYWMYRTVGDHLVRPAHRELDGVVLPYNDERWAQIFPPNGWRCRCYVVPRMKHEVSQSQMDESRRRADTYINSPQGKKEALTGWGINRAHIGVVFSEHQKYIAKFPGKRKRKLHELKFHDFGLKKYSEARKAATTDMVGYEGSAKDFYEGLEAFEGQKVVRDYHKRPLKVDAKNFKRHSTERKAYRSAYIGVMQETLKSPDEVWINGAGLGNMVYLKYYKGKTMVVVGNIKNGQIEMKSWFELAERQEVITKYRQGLLVMKR